MQAGGVMRPARQQANKMRGTGTSVANAAAKAPGAMDSGEPCERGGPSFSLSM